MEPQQTPQYTSLPKPESSTPSPAPVSHSQSSKGGGVFWKILVIFFILLLLAGGAAAGYMYYTEKQKHDETKQALTDTQSLIDENAQVLQDATLEPSYRKALQDGANRECFMSDSAILFNTTTSPEKNEDGSVKKFYAVGQYVCNFGEQVINGPVRFVAVQSYDEATWEFTYGSSTADPVSLPGYIFNTDPALFNRKYNNPKTF